jgi:hypothetical protein
MKIFSIIVLSLIICASFSLAYSNEQFLKDQSIKDLMKVYISNLESTKIIPDNQLSKVNKVLPISFEINITDTNEIIYIELNKTGDLTIPDSLEKVDLEFSMTRAVFLEFVQKLASIKKEDFKSYIDSDKISIKSNSLKLDVAIQVLEDKYKYIIVKHKTFRAKTLGFIGGKIAGLFAPKDA